MGTSFGFFTKSQKNVTFANLRANFVNGPHHPNHPARPDSPNHPRAEGRLPGYSDPVLGDEGPGQIGRFIPIKLDALGTVIDQMIEQYLRDKQWYGKVRCREALWNMYRRLEWWVKQQIDPSRNDYQRALLMIKDCIYEILKDAESRDGSHMGVSLPVCPAPYYHHFRGNYFNHFNGVDYEEKLFSLRDFPKLGAFPGFFRYVSSSEEQEWDLVYGTSANEASGFENILKLNLNRLAYGNSSKLTFYWRFKQYGFIRFKLWANTAPGNGLLFFINQEQVGGEWNQGSGWQEVKFYVEPGQTYKFDWMVRKQSERLFGNNAVYIKDIECYEVIRSVPAPTPPDFDTLREGVHDIAGYDWVTYSSKSIVRAQYDGPILPGENEELVLRYDLDAECDGEVQFAYRMGMEPPVFPDERSMFFDDLFQGPVQFAVARHGSTASSDHSAPWSLDGRKSSTFADQATVTYSVTVGDGAKVHTEGALEIICPPREIDYIEDVVIADGDQLAFSTDSVWNEAYHADGLVLTAGDPITAGVWEASTTVTVQEKATLTFDYSHQLRASETFEVWVDHLPVLSSNFDRFDSGGVIRLTPGTHTIRLRILDRFTESAFHEQLDKKYSYGKDSKGQTFEFKTELGSSVAITRNWEVDNGRAYTETSGTSSINYDLALNPGATFSLDEMLQFFHYADLERNTSDENRIFEETFNIGESYYDRRLSFSENWEWEDIVTRYNSENSGDGVWKVEGVNGSVNTIHLRDVDLSHDGYLQFEYGGTFGRYENLEVYDNGDLIWASNTNSTAAVGTNVTLPLPAGDHLIKWVYKDLSGTTIETGDPYNNVPRVECYPGGRDWELMDYDGTTGSITTDRETRIGWGGVNSQFYTNGTNPISHGTTVNGGVVTRDIYAPSYGVVDYFEYLRLYIGQAAYTGLRPYPFTLNRGDFENRQGFVTLEVKTVLYPGTNRQTATFRTGGETEIIFDYLTYLYDDRARATFRAYITGSGNFRRNLFEVAGRNIGNRQVYDNIRDWSGAEPCRWRETLPPGEYVLHFELEDTVSDADGSTDNGIKYLYYGVARYLQINVAGGIDGSWDMLYDDTRVQVDVIDKATGRVVSTKTYSKADGHFDTANSSIDFYISERIPSDSTYQIRYTLLKGNGVRGGLDGAGGAFTLRGAVFHEEWEDYCKDANGHYYPADGSPYYVPPGRVEEEIIPEDSWCWVDTIRIFEHDRDHELCADDTRLVLTLRDEDGDVVERQTYHPDSPDRNRPQRINYSYTNDSDYKQEYTLEMEFIAGDCHSGLADQAMLYEGGFLLEENLPPKPAWARVGNFQLTEHRPVWVGGCSGSEMTLKVYGVNGHAETLLQERVFTGTGIYPFAVSNLQLSAYPMYRFEIHTDQVTTVAQSTGRVYETEFRVIRFTATEEWHFVPKPFSSRLDFCIDGVLIDSYTTPGGFFPRSYPVPKGPHIFEWKFVGGERENNYDICDIDYLRLTNWICDKVLVVPYCDPGQGDKCVEALIKCLLHLWKEREQPACKIGKKIWLFT